MYGSAGSVTRCRPVNVGFIIDSGGLHGANYFGLALSRALAKWAKAIERSLSASATVGPCLEFNSPPSPRPLSHVGQYCGPIFNDLQIDDNSEDT